MKKITISLLLSGIATFAANAATMRPASTARAPSISGVSVMTGGTIIKSSSATAIAADARCALPLPNQTTSARCIQRYMACVKQENVCGEHFEACDTKNRFNSKKILCADRLLECADDGINAIYGTDVKSTVVTATCDGEQKIVQRDFGTTTLHNIDFQPNSMLDQGIKEGVSWIAGNSVQACINVADGCIRRACQGSPFKCISKETLTDGTYTELGELISADGSSEASKFRVNPEMLKQYINQLTYSAENVRNYLKGQCKTEIGTNKSCFTATNGTVPQNDQWTVDTFEVDNTYADIMTGTLNRLNANQAKILEWLAKNSFAAMDSCRNTAETCVKSACGNGSLAACYGTATQDGAEQGAHIEKTDFKGFCAGVLNANQNCRDLFAEGDDTTANELWDIVWGTAADQHAGMFNLAGKLNAELQGMFSESMVLQTRKDCQSEAEACVRSQCGNGFRDCYLNDPNLVATNSYGNTLAGNAGNTYGKSMVQTNGTADMTSNAAGGYDEKMAIKLCMMPVKKSQTCQNHFDIQYARATGMKGLDSWGTAFDVRSAWQGGSGLSMTQKQADRTCTVSKTYSASCTKDDKGNCTPADVDCAEQEMNIFKDLVADIGEEARAKLTQEQLVLKNSCEIQGNTWANKPTGISSGQKEAYPNFGLPSEQSATTNLWGSFCQVKVSMVFDDAEIKGLFDEQKLKTTAYFSLGDAVMCGSWLSQSNIDSIVKRIKEKEEEKQKAGQVMPDWAIRLTSIGVGVVGGGVLGATLGEKMGLLKEGTGAKAGDLTPEQRNDLVTFQNNVAAQKQNLDTITATNTTITEAKAVFEQATETKGAMDTLITTGSKTGLKDAAKGAIPATVIATGLKTELEAAITNAYANSDDEATNSDLQAIKSAIDGVVSAKKALFDTASSNVKLTKSAAPADTIEGIPGISGKLAVHIYTAGAGATTLTQASEELAALENALASTQSLDPGKAGLSAGAAKGINAAIGGVALGLTGWGVSEAIIAGRNAKMRQGQDEAAQAWLDSVGTKITCQLNGKPVGRYGDWFDTTTGQKIDIE